MLKIDVHKKLHGPEGDFVLSADLTVEPGEMLALYGPSGVGKTTILRMIAGLATPDGGTVSLGGQDWANTPPRERRVGFVFQDHALFSNMTVTENLAFAAGNSFELPEVFELGELVNKYPHQLSGGQRQRVAVARALVQGSDILLLDEPLSALERSLRRRIGTYLRQAVRERAVATLLVSHDLDEVIALADRVAILDGGKIVACGTPAELLLESAPDNRVNATVLAVGENDLLVRVGNQRLRLAKPAGDFSVGEVVRVAMEVNDLF